MSRFVFKPHSPIVNEKATLLDTILMIQKYGKKNKKRTNSYALCNMI